MPVSRERRSSARLADRRPWTSIPPASRMTSAARTTSRTVASPSARAATDEAGEACDGPCDDEADDPDAVRDPRVRTRRVRGSRLEGVRLPGWGCPSRTRVEDGTPRTAPTTTMVPTRRAEGTDRPLPRAPARGLHHHQAAIDGQHLTRDVGGLVGGQERDRVGDLRGVAEPAQGRALGELRP